MVTHFIADFVLQSRDMGKKKSSEPGYLAAHLAIQFLAFLLVVAFISPDKAVWFSFVNATIHGVIDWNLWRAYKSWTGVRIEHRVDCSVREALGAGVELDPTLVRDDLVKNFKYWEDHLFYTTIGFDQLLHGLTLVLLAGAFKL